MSSKVQAAEAIEVLANQYRNMVEAAAMLKQIGSLENASKEAQKAAEAAKDEAEAAKLEADLAKADAKKAKTKVTEMLTKAAEDANDALAAAQEKADAIVAQANAKAAEIDQAAVDRLAGALADVNANRARIINEINNAQDRLDGLTIDIAAKTAEAEEAQKRLDKVQAQIAKYLG
jgi:chromosome segregation ATPase